MSSLETDSSKSDATARSHSKKGRPKSVVFAEDPIKISFDTDAPPSSISKSKALSYPPLRPSSSVLSKPLTPLDQHQNQQSFDDSSRASSLEVPLHLVSSNPVLLVPSEQQSKQQGSQLLMESIFHHDSDHLDEYSPHNSIYSPQSQYVSGSHMSNQQNLPSMPALHHPVPIPVSGSEMINSISSYAYTSNMYQQEQVTGEATLTPDQIPQHQKQPPVTSAGQPAALPNPNSMTTVPAHTQQSQTAVHLRESVPRSRSNQGELSKPCSVIVTEAQRKIWQEYLDQADRRHRSQSFVMVIKSKCRNVWNWRHRTYACVALLAILLAVAVVLMAVLIPNALSKKRTGDTDPLAKVGLPARLTVIISKDIKHEQCRLSNVNGVNKEEWLSNLECWTFPSAKHTQHTPTSAVISPPPSPSSPPNGGGQDQPTVALPEVTTTVTTTLISTQTVSQPSETAPVPTSTSLTLSSSPLPTSLPILSRSVSTSSSSVIEPSSSPSPSPPSPTVNYIALNQAFYSQNATAGSDGSKVFAICGACVRISGPRGIIMATVADQCDDCRSYEVQVSFAAFDAITGGNVTSAIVDITLC
ncbi:hypothetical protein GQ42DRAFT_170971 [Ramicandelaber brevisporus]|nr:hypothetical protein GQ42DRAFT_170971 [Ramicandelaber brevisporus]